MDLTEGMVFGAGQEPVIRPEQRYEDCRFEGMDLTVQDMNGVAFVDCMFKDCKLANQKLLNVVLRNVAFAGCNLMGVNWCELKSLAEVRFERCRLDFGVFQELKLERVVMKDCSAKEVDLSETDVSFADLSGTDFTGATFGHTRVMGADFRGSRGYVFDVRTTPLKGTKFSLPEAAGLLVALGAEVD